MTSENRNILVADDVSDSGLQPLRDAGFSVEKKTGLSPDELREALVDVEGLIVRSETKVTANLMDAAGKLRVIGRRTAIRSLLLNIRLPYWWLSLATFHKRIAA